MKKLGRNPLDDIAPDVYRRVLQANGRKGGLKKSAAKTAANRANAKKPRKRKAAK